MDPERRLVQRNRLQVLLDPAEVSGAQRGRGEQRDMRGDAAGVRITEPFRQVCNSVENGSGMPIATPMSR